MIASNSLPEALTMLFLGIGLLGPAGWGRTFLKELTLYDAGRGVSHIESIGSSHNDSDLLRPSPLP